MWAIVARKYCRLRTHLSHPTSRQNLCYITQAIAFVKNLRDWGQQDITMVTLENPDHISTVPSMAKVDCSELVCAAWARSERTFMGSMSRSRYPAELHDSHPVLESPNQYRRPVSNSTRVKNTMKHAKILKNISPKTLRQPNASSCVRAQNTALWTSGLLESLKFARGGGTAHVHRDLRYPTSRDKNGKSRRI